MSKMKIIEVSSDTNIGGAGKCLLALLKNFDYDKFEVKVILPENSLLKPYIDELGILVIEVGSIANKSLDKNAIGELKRIFKAEKPDLVHTHASMSARIAAKAARTKIVYTRHSVFPPPKKISKGIGKAINGAVNNYLADGIIAVAQAAKENLTDTGVSDKKITVILNGVDGLKPVPTVKREEIKKSFGVESGERVISIIARLNEVKGHEYFINAADMLLKDGIKAKFFIAGTGDREEILREKIKSLGREKEIILTGFINNVDELLNITDVQINASFGTEATSLALLEGMSLGVPAVVSDFGGNPGVIKDGQNGFVVPKQDAAAIAEKTKELLSDKKLYGKLSDGAKEIFAKNFTAKTMTRQTEDLYTRIIKGGNKDA